GRPAATRFARRAGVAGRLRGRCGDPREDLSGLSGSFAGAADGASGRLAAAGRAPAAGGRPPALWHGGGVLHDGRRRGLGPRRAGGAGPARGGGAPGATAPDDGPRADAAGGTALAPPPP